MLTTLGCGNTRTEYGTFDADGITRISLAVAFLLRWAGFRGQQTGPQGDPSVGDAGSGCGALLLGMRATGLLPYDTKYIGVELMKERVQFANSVVKKKNVPNVAFHAGEYTVGSHSVACCSVLRSGLTRNIPSAGDAKEWTTVSGQAVPTVVVLYDYVFNTDALKQVLGDIYRALAADDHLLFLLVTMKDVARDALGFLDGDGGDEDFVEHDNGPFAAADTAAAALRDAKREASRVAYSEQWVQVGLPHTLQPPTESHSGTWQPVQWCIS